MRASRKLRLATGVFLNPSHLILRQGLSVNLGIVVLERPASQRSLDSLLPLPARLVYAGSGNEIQSS